MADISHWFMKRRGIAVGIAASGNYMAGVVWPLLMTGVLEESGWRTVFGMMAVIVPVCVLPLALFLRRQLPYAEGRVAAAAAAARVQTVQFSPRQLQVMLMIAGIGCCMAMSMPQVHIVALCTDLGYGPAVGAEMLSLMLLGGVASRLISGFLADWLGGVRTVLLGSFGQCIALFLYLPFDGLVSLYVVSMVFGLEAVIGPNDCRVVPDLKKKCFATHLVRGDDARAPPASLKSSLDGPRTIRNDPAQIGGAAGVSPSS